MRRRARWAAAVLVLGCVAAPGPAPAHAAPGDDNLAVTVTVEPHRPASGQRAEIRVHMRDPDPGTVVSKIVVDTGDGRRHIVYFTHLACSEVTAPGGVDGTYVLPHTYTKPGEYVARAEVTATQRICWVHLDDTDIGVGTTNISVD